MTVTNHTLFDEEQWLKLIFFSGDTSKWIDEQQRQLLQLAPVNDNEKLHRKKCYLSAATFRGYTEVAKATRKSQRTLPYSLDLSSQICFNKVTAKQKRMQYLHKFGGGY